MNGPNPHFHEPLLVDSGASHCIISNTNMNCYFSNKFNILGFCLVTFQLAFKKTFVFWCYSKLKSLFWSRMGKKSLRKQLIFGNDHFIDSYKINRKWKTIMCFRFLVGLNNSLLNYGKDLNLLDILKKEFEISWTDRISDAEVLNNT